MQLQGKNTDRVKRQIARYEMDLTVLHEPGNGLSNSLACALGVKQEETFCLLRKGQLWEMQHVRRFRNEILTLACDGLDYENSNWIHQFIEMFKTTDAQIRDICGEPDKVEIVENKNLWFYHLLSHDNKSEKKVYIRFNENNRYTGISMSNRLLRPSHVSIQFSQEYWDEVVVPVMGTEDSDDCPLEIAFAQDNVSSMIGGGHPRKIIEPGRWFDRELEDGTYLLRLQIMDRKEGRRIKKLDLIEELTIAPDEDVQIIFSGISEPEITRSVYQSEAGNRTSIAKEHLLKKPDFKQMAKESGGKPITLDDPKFLPWQLHLKEIASR